MPQWFFGEFQAAAVLSARNIARPTDPPSKSQAHVRAAIARSANCRACVDSNSRQQKSWLEVPKVGGLAWSLNGLGECTIDNEVGAGNAACHRARKEDDARSDFLRRTHTSGGVQRHRRLVEIGYAALNILPDAALKVSVARRHRVDADALADELVAEPFGVMNQRGLEGAVGASGEINLDARDTRDDHDRGGFGFLQIRKGRRNGVDGMHHVGAK
jgi:hypothetical protein